MMATIELDKACFEANFLQCPVCQDTYDQKGRKPKVLTRCLHTACLSCIEGIYKSAPASTSSSARSFKCPACRKEYRLSTEEIRDLPTDHRAIQMMDLLSTSKPKLAKSVCQNHEDQPLNFFCKTCTNPICRDCTVVDHREAKGHEIIGIKNALEENERDISEIEHKTSEILRQLQGKSGIYDNAKERLKRMKHDITRRIETQFEEYQKILKIRQAALTNIADKFFTEQEKKIQLQQDDVDKGSSYLQKLHGELTSSKDDNDVAKIFTMTSRMKDEINKFENMAQEDDTELFQSCQFVDQNEAVFCATVYELGEIQQRPDESLKAPPSLGENSDGASEQRHEGTQMP